MRRIGWGIWVLALALLAPRAAACGLQAELMQVAPGLQGPPLAAAVRSRARIDPGQTLRLRLPRDGSAHWLRLRCDGALARGEPWLLVMQGANRLGAVTFHPPGAPEQHAWPAEHAAGSSLLRQGWALALPNGWPAGSVAYLQLNGRATEPVLLRLAHADALAREQRGAARTSIAVFTVLLLTALAAMGVYALFRDLLYLSYAAYLACAALYLVLLSGDAAEMPLLANFAAYGPTGHWAIATLAVALQLVFTRRILELDRVLPRGACALRVLAAAHLGLLAVLLIGRAQVHGWYYLAGNGLLMLCTPLVLGLALWARRRGAAYAGYYLLGWVPMLALVALTAANQLGLVPAAWAEHLLPYAAVFESTVLAVALSRHAAHRHRIALLARQSPERDVLTGALNADALERMLESWRQLGALGARRYCVLLLDLDEFAQVNARHGRWVGDATLQQVVARIRATLRPDDTVARVGGDSFAVVSECDFRDIQALARRMRDAICARPLKVDGHTIELSASIGLAASVRGEPAAMLIQRARRALQHTRGLGRNALGVAAHARRRPVLRGAPLPAAALDVDVQDA